MPRDKRLFMTFPNDFWQHPKLEFVSDAAFRAFVEMNGYSRMQDLDGRIPVNIAKRKWKPKAIQELLDTHPDRPVLLHDGDDYVLRDYAEHQETRADREARIARNTENGRRGGRPRKNPTETHPVTESVSESEPTGNPEQTDQKAELEIETELEIEIQGNASHSPAREPKTIVVDEVEESFARAWKGWPKKDDRKTALSRYRTAAKVRGGLAELEADVLRFGKAYVLSAEEMRFVPGLAMWLNRERWNDDIPTPALRSMTRTEQNLAFVAKLAAEEQGAPEARRPTRDDQNMAVVRRLEAREREQRPTRGQEHLAYIASLGSAPGTDLVNGRCTPGRHTITDNGSCAVCAAPPWELEQENPF